MARQRDKKRHALNHQVVLAIKAGRPCSDCHVSYPPHVMQFDHVRGVKKFNVGCAAWIGLSLKTILEEIEKCELVCANCHCERTHARKFNRAGRNDDLLHRG